MAKSTNGRVLFIIDPQNCFMDAVEQIGKAVRATLTKADFKPDPMPLPIDGAVADMQRLSTYIKSAPYRYDAIVVTLDTHPADHISHAIRWVDADGNQPDPFTLILSADYEAGKWFAADPAEQKKQGQYLKDLEAAGRLHTIWPPHGNEELFEHQVQSDLQDALDYWESTTGNQVRYVKKGMHRDTEQFGIFAATVPVPNAPETLYNQELADYLNSFAFVDIAGEASSHCALDSTEQYLSGVPESDWSKVTVFTDTMSPVAAVVDQKSGTMIADFPAQADTWLAGLPGRGVAVTTTSERMAA